MLAGRSTKLELRPQNDAEIVGAADGLAPKLTGYQVNRQLGAGGQGHVWLAVRSADGLQVAVKVITSTGTSNNRSRVRFEQSITTLAALDHPGIVHSVEFGQLPGGEFWHATEFVPGRTLLEHVEHLDQQFRQQRGSESRLPVRKIVELFVRICEAVEAAHRVGVIHRDLKPSNIVVDDRDQPKLLDFGHATAPELVSHSSITVSGEFLGTPAYASPEQVLCRPGTIDVRSDLYSIGVMLYQCLTGTFPYDVTGSLARTFQNIQYADPVPPRNHVPWIERDLQAIVVHALAKRREDRYQAVGDLREDLQRYLRGEAVQARAAGIGYQLLTLVRRHRVWAAAITSIVMVTIAYAASVTVLFRRATLAESRARHSAVDAQQKFSIARQTLDYVISQIETRLDRVTGTRELRQDLLEECYRQLATLAELHGASRELRKELAAVHRKMGNIAHDLMRDEDAARHWQESLGILEELAMEDPDDVSLLESLSIGHVLLGDLAKGSSRWEEVRDRYQRALAIDERLAAGHPNEARLLDNLAWSYERTAGRFWCPDPARRREFHGKRHQVALDLVSRISDRPIHLYNLCVSHMIQARLAAEDERAAYLEHLRQSVALGGRIVEAEPLNGQFVFATVCALFMQLEDHLRIGDVRAALPILERVISLADSIHLRDSEGHWGRQLKSRSKEAANILARIRENPCLAGADLRNLLPRREYGDL